MALRHFFLLTGQKYANQPYRVNARVDLPWTSTSASGANSKVYWGDAVIDQGQSEKQKPDRRDNDKSR